MDPNSRPNNVIKSQCFSHAAERGTCKADQWHLCVLPITVPPLWETETDAQKPYDILKTVSASSCLIQYSV